MACSSSGLGLTGNGALHTTRDSSQEGSQRQTHRLVCCWPEGFPGGGGCRKTNCTTSVALTHVPTRLHVCSARTRTSQGVTIARLTDQPVPQR